MDLDEKVITLVTNMIKCHEDGDFAKLTSLMDRRTLEDKDTFFTQEKFTEVTQKIQQQLGQFLSVEYIGSLNKKNSIHTLWKTRYSKTDEDIMWQVRIGLGDNQKILLMTVN